jgi:hypothetical protein
MSLTKSGRRTYEPQLGTLVFIRRMAKYPSIRERRIIETSLATLVLLAGFLIRIHYLDERPFWVDEAESSINALTILENGFPTDAYLGIPIYENTLIQPWPGNAEYEFRDLSYSDKHLAVYHGWLPLYAIAGSFALHGVTPDSPDGALALKHDLNEWKRRTRAARLPAVLFGVLFLAVIFAGGKILYGRDAAWAGLLVASVYPYHIAISRQARYYSAEVALTTTCAVSLWLLVKDGKWRHVYLTAATFILLFHTHLLSFSAASLMCLLVAPVIVRRHVAGLLKLTTFGALVAAGTVPWIVATGFYRQQERIPRAWTLLNLPSDFVRYPPIQVSSAATGIVIALLTGCVVLIKPRFSLRLASSANKLVPVLLFLGVWAACGYATFVACVPAVSFDSGRLNMSYWGPLFLLASVTAAATARVLVPRYSVVVAPVLLLMVFMAMGRRPNFHETFAGGNWKAETVVLDQLRAMSMDRTTKLYAAPNDHLILSFYSGLPVQDITPVRKSYLDSYRGNIIYVDRSVAVETGFLTAESIQEAAQRDGVKLSSEAAETWSILLRTRDYREAMLKSVSRGALQQVEPVPPFGRQLLDAHERNLSSVFTKSSLELATRGFAIRSWTDWRNVLKYRFVWPEAHSSVNANYADRLRGSDAVILTEADTAVYFCRWHPANLNNGIEFRFAR